MSAFLTEFDLHLLAEGTHFRSWERLGAHPLCREGVTGVRFAVQAPAADHVSVIGDFNAWTPGRHPLTLHPAAGVWEAFVPEATPGSLYKFWIAGGSLGAGAAKADPYAFAAECRPGTASRVTELDGYVWGDGDWLARRRATNWRAAPISTYEIHLGSWQRVAEEGGRWLTYAELAQRLPEYVADMGYTHVEFLPVTEHPLDASWGYQTTGYFAPTSRHGTPHDFMALVDALHQRGIGVWMDWVPAHFPRDAHGLAEFDGTCLYEHADPRQGEHTEWGTKIFNFGRWEVRNFLVSNALFWLERYHVDGFRVDAVASMLYLDYARREGDWIPNRRGGRENLEAVDFLRLCNQRVYAAFPDAVTVAEESTSWPLVSRPTDSGGLGFGFKWDMGWMNDTLRYFARDPVHRKYHHSELTFRQLYAFAENFVLPLSHDEVVHGKASLLAKMPGDDWQRFANLRLLFGYQFAQPGKKLLFMGGDVAQREEWNHDGSVAWSLLEFAPHRGIQAWVRDLNHAYRRFPALHELDCEAEGFEWVDCHDNERSTLSFLRRDRAGHEVVAAFNFTPTPRHGFRLALPRGGVWQEFLNSDATLYGGSNLGNAGRVVAEEVPHHGRSHSALVTLPPLAVIFLRPETE